MKRKMFLGVVAILFWPTFANAAAFITNANVWLEQRRFDTNYWEKDDQSFILAGAAVNYQDSTSNSTDNPVILNSTHSGTVTMNYGGFWNPTDEGFIFKLDHAGDIASMETSYGFSIDNVPGSDVTRVISPGSYNPSFDFVVPTAQGASLSWGAVDGAEGYSVSFWNLTQTGDIDTSTILYSSEFLLDTQYVIPDYYYTGEYALSIEAKDIIGGQVIKDGQLINRTRYYTVSEAADYDNDFNADSISDILFQHSDDGRLLIWTMNNFTRNLHFPNSLANSWSVVGKGDFNGNGTSDVLYRRDIGETAIAEMTNAERSNLTFPGGIKTVWSVKAVGDFDGDGSDDIFWQRSTDGVTAIWEIEDSTRKRISYPGGLASFWRVAGVGDFDNDGTDDILCQHKTDGRLLVWKMHNLIRASVKFALSLDSTWTVVGVGDFNNDGTDDVLYRKNSGGTAIAEFNNLNRSALKFPGGIGLPWSVKDVGDYDGDGTDDIFFRRSSDGVTLAWGIVNSTRSKVAWPGGLATQWVVQ